MSNSTPLKPKTTSQRRAVTIDNSKLVAVRLPSIALAQVDLAVIEQDTDRSKFIRSAINAALLKSSNQH